MEFDGDSAVAVYDAHAIVLCTGANGVLHAVRRPYDETYWDEQPDDWEHVFSGLPSPLLIPVVFTWIVGRFPTSSNGRPVQLSLLRLDELPPLPTDDPTPASLPDPYDEWVDHPNLVRVPFDLLPRPTDRLRRRTLADPETLALVCAARSDTLEPNPYLPLSP